MLNNIKKLLNLNNYIIEDDSDFIFSSFSPSKEKEEEKSSFKLKIFNNLKKINNIIINTLISLKYNEEISLKNFLNNYCYDSKNNKTNKMEEVKKIIYKDGNLKILPKYFKEFTNLLSIEIINSNVENIDILKDIIFLQNINLSFNNIINISCLNDLKYIEDINLSHNKITDINENTFEKNKLIKVNLGYNNLTNVNFLYYLVNVQNLNLEGNNLTNDILLNRLDKINFLKILNLNNNNLTNLIFSTKKEFHWLEVLYVNNNNLTSLNGLFLSDTLFQLEAKNNKIKTIEHLREKHIYESILLENNPLKYIKLKQNIEEYIASEKTLDFDYNDLIIYNDRKSSIESKLKERTNKRRRDKIIKIQSGIKEEKSNDLDISFF
jgi:hypothetical protein